MGPWGGQAGLDVPATSESARRWLASVRAALGLALAACERKFAASGLLAGSTCTAVLQTGWLLTCANLGDSSAWLDTGGGTGDDGRAEADGTGGLAFKLDEDALALLPPVRLTRDHRLDPSPDGLYDAERSRLAHYSSCGYSVGQLAVDLQGPAAPGTQGLGPHRIWPGGLAVCRGVGDFDVGAPVVCAPAVTQCRLPVTGGRIVIASDGLWDTPPPDGETVQSVRRLDTARAARRLLRVAARNYGLNDDATIVVVDVLPADAAGRPWNLMGSGKPPSKRQARKVEAVENAARTSTAGNVTGRPLVPRNSSLGSNLFACFGGVGGGRGMGVVDDPLDPLVGPLRLSNVDNGALAAPNAPSLPRRGSHSEPGVSPSALIAGDGTGASPRLLDAPIGAGSVAGPKTDGAVILPNGLVLPPTVDPGNVAVLHGANSDEEGSTMEGKTKQGEEGTALAPLTPPRTPTTGVAIAFGALVRPAPGAPLWIVRADFSLLPTASGLGVPGRPKAREPESLAGSGAPREGGSTGLHDRRGSLGGFPGPVKAENAVPADDFAGLGPCLLHEMAAAGTAPGLPPPCPLDVRVGVFLEGFQLESRAVWRRAVALIRRGEDPHDDEEIRAACTGLARRCSERAARGELRRGSMAGGRRPAGSGGKSAQSGGKPVIVSV